MRKIPVLALVVALSMAGTAIGGPFILDHTDADDHGFFNGANNVDGWLYMQRVLENLAPGVTNGSMQVVQLGGSSTALTAATSAFDGSTLAGGGGWTFHSIDGTTALTDFFAGTSAVNINTAGIIMLDSGNNVTGGITPAEGTILNANATPLDNFLGGGGALHSLANDHTGTGGKYGWLSILLPGITFNGNQSSGLTLTAAGQAAFPGLTNADLSAGPFHGQWTGGTGALTILFTGPSNNPLPVGIGSSGGSVTQPGIPEPGTIILFGMGVLGAAGVIRRRRRTAK